MIILSLFDGISCGRLAFQRAGIQVTEYYASEIDPFAIEISRNNFPDIRGLYDIRDIHYRNECLHYGKESIYRVTPDIIIGGSPCQNLSRAGNKKGLQGDKSMLFWDFVRLLKEIKPKYFLFENVASMKKSNKEIITNTLKKIFPDTKCYMINSSLVSAQNRKRYYWTNIPNITQPEDKNILLQDILQPQYDGEETGLYAIKQRARGFNAGNIFEKKSPTITSNSWEQNNHIVDTTKKEIIRKLTPIECERLQTLPDNYTAGLSNSQRYRVIGNSWTVDVIAHILSFLK